MWKVSFLDLVHPQYYNGATVCDRTAATSEWYSCAQIMGLGFAVNSPIAGLKLSQPGAILPMQNPKTWKSRINFQVFSHC